MILISIGLISIAIILHLSSWMHHFVSVRLRVCFSDILLVYVHVMMTDTGVLFHHLFIQPVTTINHNELRHAGLSYDYIMSQLVGGIFKFVYLINYLCFCVLGMLVSWQYHYSCWEQWDSSSSGDVWCQ